MDETGEQFYLFPCLAENSEKREKFIGILQYCIKPDYNSENSDVEYSEHSATLRKRLRFLKKQKFTEDSDSDIEPVPTKRIESNPNPRNNSEKESKQTTCFPPISLIVLGGFTTALGIAAVALALTVMIATPPVILAVVLAGSAAIIAGAAMMGVGFFKHCPPKATQGTKPSHSIKTIKSESSSSNDVYSEEESSYSSCSSSS